MKKKPASLFIIALLLGAIGATGFMLNSNNQAEALSGKQRVIYSADSSSTTSSLNIAKKYFEADAVHIMGQGYWQNLEGAFDNAVYNLAPNNERMMFASSLQWMQDGIPIAKQLGVESIAYNAETWDFTPEEEQSTPIESFNQAAAIAHNNGFKFAYNPTMSIFKGPDVNYLKQDWTKADILIIPFGGMVVFPSNFKLQVQNIVDHVTSVNPNIEIYMFVSLRYATPTQIIDAMDSVKTIVDGAAISYHPENGCLYCSEPNLDKILAGITALDSGGTTPPPPPSNNPPIANAGPDQTVAEDVTVTLDGTVSSDPDPDGTIQSYSWTQTLGSTVTLDNPNAATPLFTAPNVGSAGETLTFELRVTDNDGALAVDTVDILIQNVNQLPAADAGPDFAVDEGTTGVQLQGSGTDPDGTIDSYLWDQIDGPPQTLSASNTTSATFDAPSVSAATDLTFRLTVTDEDGGTAEDTVVVTVNNVNFNQLPTANAGADKAVNEGNNVALDGTASSDPDGTIQSYSWTQSSGTLVSLSDPLSPNPTFTAPSVGAAGEVLTFNLTVSDSLGLADPTPDSVSITVNDSITYPITHMSDTTKSSKTKIANGDKTIVGELVTASSQLVGDKIDQITLRLKKTGSPSGNAIVGIFDNSGNLKKQFGTKAVNSFTTSPKDYGFTLSGGQLYTIVPGDRIGIKYTGGNPTTNYISITIDTNAANPFDGTQTHYQQFKAGSWSGNNVHDTYMILKQTHG